MERPNPQSPETRAFQIRAAPEDGRVIKGYAVVFNAPADLGWCKEIIDPRAFEGVDLSDVRMLWSHDTARVLGRAGVNLELLVDDQGLLFRCSLPDTCDGNDAFELVTRGIVDQCSFGFWTSVEEWDDINGIRTVRKIKALMEITVCAWGAYPQTVVEAIAPAEEPSDTSDTPMMDLGLLADAYSMD